MGPYNGSKFRDGTFDTVHGLIKDIESSHQIIVKLYNGETVTIPSEFLTPVPPEKKDSVKIIGGEYKNQIGSLISVDGLDGVVKLGVEFKVMSMKLLAKHVP